MAKHKTLDICKGCKAINHSGLCIFILSTFYERFASECPCTSCLVKPICSNKRRNIYAILHKYSSVKPCRVFQTYRKAEGLQKYLTDARP